MKAGKSEGWRLQCRREHGRAIGPSPSRRGSLRSSIASGAGHSWRAPSASQAAAPALAAAPPTLSPSPATSPASIWAAACSAECKPGALRFTSQYALATRTRVDLAAGLEPARLAAALDAKARSLFGHSLRLRQVSAGGCNACEADVNVLGTVVFDLGRFGIQLVASPRHADGLLVTGPVPLNMKLALQKTWQPRGAGRSGPGGAGGSVRPGLPATPGHHPGRHTATARPAPRSRARINSHFRALRPSV